MGGTKLERAQVEKDLGVIVDQNLSGSSQCVAAVKKVNRMLDLHSQEYQVLRK